MVFWSLIDWVKLKVMNTIAELLGISFIIYIFIGGLRLLCFT